MAVQLTIDITDAEQAKLEEIVELLLPGKTPAQVKVILETHAKRLLFRDIKERVNEHRYEQVTPSVRQLFNAVESSKQEDDDVLIEPTTEFSLPEEP